MANLLVGELEGQTAIVTGGSRGIGRAVVERLAREGTRVVFAIVMLAGSDARWITGQNISANGGIL